MAQERLRDYKDPVGSFQHNLFNLGLHNPGRYVGFDTIEPLAGLQFKLKHTSTGFEYKNAADNVIGPCGVLVTPQGVIIMEDEEITPLSIETNAGNTEVRYDLIVCNHSYTINPGGDPATYEIIKGPVGNPIKPVIPDPLKQTAVGVLIIPPTSMLASEISYEKAKCPDSGDGEDARLLTPNMFQAFQGLKTSETIYPQSGDELISGGHIAKLWKVNNDGNTFIFAPNAATNLDAIDLMDIPLQYGMRINLLINSNITLRESRFFESEAFYGDGYRGFIINPGITNVSIGASGGGSLLGIKPTLNETWDIELVYMYVSTANKGRWFVSSIGGAGAKSQFTRGMTMEWYGDIAANFDDSGFGLNLMSGWHICNGNGGTPDRRGKGSVMATNVPAAGRPVLTEADVITAGGDPEDYIFLNSYSQTGKTKFAISQANLPDVELPVTDPGHSHTYTRTNDSSHPSGNATNSPRTNATATTGVSTTGITVRTGGSDERLEHISPVWATVYVMKL